MKELKRLAARSLLLVLLAAALAACEDGNKRPPQVTVTVVHAAPSFPNVDFLRGANDLSRVATLPYLGVAQSAFDADLYNYTLTVTRPGVGAQAVGTFSHSIGPDRYYTYVLVETAGTIAAPLILEQPVFASTSTSTEISIAHASESTGTVDVYVEPPGTVLQTAAPRASLSFRGTQSPLAVPAGEYVVTITASGAVANVLFTSSPLTFAAGQTRVLAIAGGAGAGTSDLALILASAAPSAQYDINAGSAVRAINTVADRAARDVYAGGDFAAPLIAATAFGAASDFTATGTGDTTLSITPAGNPSVIEREITPTLAAGGIYNLIIAGDSSSGVTAGAGIDDHRVITDEARVLFINAFNGAAAADFYLYPPGTDITTVFPTFQLGSPGFSSRVSFPVGGFELTIRDPATSTIVFGPQTLTFPATGIYTIVAVDSANVTTADVVLLDDFP